MSHQFPPDVEERIRAKMSDGDYVTEGDLMRDALEALDAQNEDLAAIQAGIDDMESGRVEPLETVANDIRKEHGWTSDA